MEEGATVTVDIEVKGDSLFLTGNVVDNGDGTYTVTYTPVSAGPLIITVLLDGVPISGMPVEVGKTPKVDLTKSTLTLSSSGDNIGFTITAKDKNGNIIPVEFYHPQFTVDPKTVTIGCVLGAAQSCTVTPTAGGLYTISATLNGSPIQGSPAQVLVIIKSS